jgi:hypothetical protein
MMFPGARRVSEGLVAVGGPDKPERFGGVDG